VARDDDAAIAGYVADLLEDDERRGAWTAAPEWVMAKYSLVAEREVLCYTLGTVGAPVGESMAAHQP
jgi:hypothetical protein